MLNQFKWFAYLHIGIDSFFLFFFFRLKSKKDKPNGQWRLAYVWLPYMIFDNTSNAQAQTSTKP